jgi:glycosyltransferase involved in cell wall biosynthesis
MPEQIAGTEVYVWALTKALRKEGHEVKVLIPNYNSATSNEYSYDDILVYQYAEPSVVDRQLIMGFREPDGLAFFTSYLSVENPDIIHFHELAGSNGIGLEHVKKAKNYGAKVIMTMHLARYSCLTGSLMYKSRVPCDGRISIFKCSTCQIYSKGLTNTSNIIAGVSVLMEKLNIDTTKSGNSLGTLFGTSFIVKRLDQSISQLVDQCDQIVCISKWYLQVLKTNGISQNKLSYIGQGLPTASMTNLKSEKRNGRLKLMFLGRITPIKGLHLLIDAIDKISDTEVELSIFGKSDGTGYEHQLKNKTKGKLNVVWKGTLPQNRVQEEMHNHDILCLCSTVCEMSPLVIQEARAANLPILASRVLGNSEQIKHGENGLIFEFNNIDSLRKQIMKLIQNKKLLSALKSSRVESRSFEIIANDYITLYEKVSKEQVLTDIKV